MSKIYFASDFHLGLDARVSSKEREKQIVQWLQQIRIDAEEIYLVGDLFDFWFEYSSVVPRGYCRLLGTLASLRDQGIPIYLFTGNHDMWMFGYFEVELGITIYREPILKTFAGKKFLIGHGDGLGPGDKGYKFIKAVFASKLCQWLFARLHPNFAFKLAKYWSGQSREHAPAKDRFISKENEWLVQYANAYLKEQEVDFFVFGHRHIPIDCLLDNGHSRYINLGDWLNFNSYAVFDEKTLSLQFFKNQEGEILHL